MSWATPLSCRSVGWPGKMDPGRDNESNWCKLRWGRKEFANHPHTWLLLNWLSQLLEELGPWGQFWNGVRIATAIAVPCPVCLHSQIQRTWEYYDSRGTKWWTTTAPHSLTFVKWLTCPDREIPYQKGLVIWGSAQSYWRWPLPAALGEDAYGWLKPELDEAARDFLYELFVNIEPEWMQWDGAGQDILAHSSECCLMVTGSYFRENSFTLACDRNLDLPLPSILGLSWGEGCMKSKSDILPSTWRELCAAPGGTEACQLLIFLWSSSPSVTSSRFS